MDPKSHFMEPGAVAFVPGWVILFIIILSMGAVFPGLFVSNNNLGSNVINPAFFAFIVGSLMPVFDDLLAYIFGKPFAHHSLFHSFLGPIITYVFFLVLSPNYASYAFMGNLSHSFFNFYLDRVAFFFPFSYKEHGLSDLVGVGTRALKAIHYPLIFLFFAYSLLKFFLR